jgi:hypothetical protein
MFAETIEREGKVFERFQRLADWLSQLTFKKDS